MSSSNKFQFIVDAQGQQSESVNKTENEENIILISFHPNNETKDLKKRLDEINNNVVFHTELELCIHFIQSIQKQKIFLITSSFQILSHLTNLHQIDNIFIFCLSNEQYKHSLLDNSKIIGIYDNLDLLCSSLQEQIKLVNKQFYLWAFFDQDEYANKDSSKQSSEFLWFQLFPDVI
jgi:hypothetical protein